MLDPVWFIFQTAKAAPSDMTVAKDVKDHFFEDTAFGFKKNLYFSLKTKLGKILAFKSFFLLTAPPQLFLIRQRCEINVL